MCIDKTEYNVQLANLAGHAVAAMNGNVASAKFIFDNAGESASARSKEKEIELKEREVKIREEQHRSSSAIDPDDAKETLEKIAAAFDVTAPERRLEDFE